MKGGLQRQVVFYWTLLARRISQFFDACPHLKPAVHREEPLPGHQARRTERRPADRAYLRMCTYMFSKAHALFVMIRA